MPSLFVESPADSYELPIETTAQLPGGLVALGMSNMATSASL